jgi:TRAP-type C4-dicarboxylate transport system permease small subunit
MAEPTTTLGRPTDPVGRALYGIASVLAVFGGVLCSVIAALVTVSVIGRYLFSAPIPGDYDIVGIIAGCAIFSFLPYCQMRRGNVLVDFFTTRASPRAKAGLDALGSLIYLAVAGMFTWRLYFGLLEMQQSQEVIAAFNFYRWWTVPYDIACMVVLILAIAYTLVRDIADVGGAKPEAGGVRRP